MPNIQLYNASGRDKTFEVHGFNNNQNVTVKSHTTSIIPYPNNQQHSGAIIAVHDGHEGEQTEITFNGWGDLETFDISVIVGAGGNMTVEQVGAPWTRKGDPQFMQDLRSHYARADANTKAALRNCIHFDQHGQVSRIEAPKFFPALESFVRTFAEGKVYIGVGAWQGNQGDAGDNAQSSGTKGGNKDIKIVYSDADTPAGVHDFFASSKAVIKAVELDHKVVRQDDAAPGITQKTNGTSLPTNGSSIPEAADQQTLNGTAVGTESIPEFSKSVKPLGRPSPFQGDPDHGGPGIIVGNKSSQECTYFFFNNYWNGNGTAGANFDKPQTSVTLHPHTSAFISLSESFKGRVQRGKFIPATWVEFQLAAANGTGAWGDISLEQGYDGPAMIRSLDGSNYGNGFTHDILPDAPAAAVTVRAQDGVRTLASTMGNWLGGPNQAAIEYENRVVGQKKAYIVGGEGTSVVNSKNKRMAVDFF
jgi:hypothetical protein